MIMRTLSRSVLALLLLTSVRLAAQPTLKGTIGLDAPPDDKSVICTAPMFMINAPWDLNYYPQFPIDTIPDFTLYTKDTVAVTASRVLATGKPMVLIAGSYTCDVFRYAIPQINQLALRYKDSISLYLVYTLEAHPIVDPNFYRNGQNWVVKNDSIDDVLYRQPANYGARRAIIDTMIRRQTSPPISPTIILDGPCNEWWRAFGPAPNCAYLIASDGHVVKHQPWFNVKWTAGQQAPQPDFLATYVDSVLHPKGNAGVRASVSSATILWPNPIPAGGVLHLSTSALCQMTLFDLLGRPVLSKEVRGALSLDGIATGSYFYKLEGESTRTGRVIVAP